MNLVMDDSAALPISDTFPGWRKWLQSSQKGSIIMLDSISRNSRAVHAGDLEDRVMEFVVDNKEFLPKRCARGHTK